MSEENLTSLTSIEPVDDGQPVIEEVSTDTAMDELDALTKDLSAVDLEAPLFPDGAVVVMEIKAGTLVYTKDTNQPQIEFELATVNPEKLTKGRTAKPGRKFKHRIYLGKISKKGEDLTEINDRNLANFKVACGKPKAGAFGHPSTYVGSRLTAVMTIEKGQGAFGDQNRIKRFVAPGGAKASNSSSDGL